MIKKYIKRPIYLKKIKPFIDKEIIKVLVGQRRVGKSYLLYQIMDLIKEKSKNVNIIYIDKEDYEFDFIKDYKDLLVYIKKQRKKNKKSYIFIDEIQDIQDFEKALRSLYSKKNNDIYCTGSNAHLLSSEFATYLSGRHVEIEVNSLSYPEFLIFHKLKNTNESLLRYFKYGGLPPLIHLPLKDEIIYGYLNNIYNTILFKDIVRRFKIRSTVLLEQLVEFLCDNTGSILSAKKISDFLKSQKIHTAPKVILDYLSYLVSAYFVYKVSRLDIPGKKIFEINDKYYLQDLGLRHSIIGYRQTDINKIMENLVYMHLKINGYQVYVGKLENKEIDFVGKKGDKRLYIQVTYLMENQKVRDREFGNLLKIVDNYQKIVVSMDKMIEGNVKGIEHIHLRDFLSTNW